MKLSAEIIEYVKKYWNQSVVQEEIKREEEFPLVDIQTTIAWLKIKEYLNKCSISNILDAGAGFGRYSIPLAKFGYKVTHFDISPNMIHLAKVFADKNEIKNINFKLGTIVDLDVFKSQSYDLTISFDSPISYCYPHQEKAIEELCRVTKNYLILMVSSRTGVLPFMIDFDIEQKYIPKGYSQKVDPFLLTNSILKEGIEKWPSGIEEYLKSTGKDAPLDYSFEIDELISLLNKNQFETLEIGGLGALARSIKTKNLEKIRADERLFNKFINLSLDFDFNKYNIGLGAVNIFVIAKRKV